MARDFNRISFLSRIRHKIYSAQTELHMQSFGDYHDKAQALYDEMGKLIEQIDDLKNQIIDERLTQARERATEID